MASGLAQPALDRAAAWLAPGGWLSLETHGETSRSSRRRSKPMAERRFGKAMITLLRNR